MITALIQSILSDLQHLPALANADAVVFREDDADPAARVFRGDTSRIRIMVAATGHTRSQDAGPSTAGDAAIEITVFENPKLRLDDSLHLTDAAEAVALALHWKLYDGFQHLRYIDMQRTDADEDDARMVVTFFAQAALDLTDPVSWTADETTVLGSVISRTIVSSGVPAFEPDCAGDAAFIGVRDRHFEIDLTCRAAISSEDELPPAGSPFEYNGKSYITTTASISSASEDAATCRLQGRTLPIR